MRKRESEPNVRFPVDLTRADYVIIAEGPKLTLAQALTVAEDVLKKGTRTELTIYRYDSTVELINGVVCVRGRE